MTCSKSLSSLVRRRRRPITELANEILLSSSRRKSNISGSIALSKVRFVFKNFIINTEQKIIFLSQSNRPQSAALVELNVLTEFRCTISKIFQLRSKRYRKK